MAIKKAYFAGGCFWCMMPVFRAFGAKEIRSGYSGGEEVNPTYEDVKHQKTGHRETVMIAYDPDVTSYEKLLKIFLANIDPYDDGGQFIDRGHSYTTAVYYTDEDEKNMAEKAIDALEKESGKKCTVVIEKLKVFYEAEEYHQDYDIKNPEAMEKELIESGRKKA